MEKFQGRNDKRKTKNSKIFCFNGAVVARSRLGARERVQFPRSRTLHRSFARKVIDQALK